MPQRRARRERQLDEIARRFTGLLPPGYAAMSDVQRLEHVLHGTLEGASILASCNPLELLPQQLAIWNEVRRHVWTIMMTERHRREDAEALSALSERFGNVQQSAERKTEEEAVGKKVE